MVPGANSPRSKGQDCSANSICDDKEDIVNPFCGDDNLPLRTSREFSERGFYNPDGKSCSVIAALALLQYIKPLMDLVASKKGALCQKLHEIYQLRGLKDESILKPLDELRTLLGFPTDEDMDANEFMYTLLGQILKDEDLIGQIFSGKLKEKMTLDSSSTGEVTLEQVSDIPGNDADGESPVYSIGLTKTSNDITVRDLLSKKLSETRSAIPFNEWNDEWKKKYPEGEADAECHKMNYFDPAPQVTILALERGTGSTDKKDNRPVKIPNIIPEADFTHPEDECIHSMHSGGGGSLFLFGMIMYSEVRNHYYSMVGVNDTSWIVHGDLSTYQLDMTDDLLKDLGRKDRKDSSITFIYIKDRDLSVAKPPLPDKVEQRDILQRLGSRQCKKTTADCVVIDDDQDKVDYQQIFHDMEESMRSFVGLEPLKQQFLRFAKTAILNHRRKQLGFQVEDMNTCLHFIFQGNPGTGKTTFARKVSDLLYSLKKIKKRGK